MAYPVPSLRMLDAFGEHWLVPRGRSLITAHGGDGGGFHPTMVRTCARAFALSVIPENRRRDIEPRKR